MNADPSGATPTSPTGPTTSPSTRGAASSSPRTASARSTWCRVLDGSPYLLARNALSGSEFTGVNFSPDRSTLFANIQDEGYVFAITGPWAEVLG